MCTLGSGPLALTLDLALMMVLVAVWAQSKMDNADRVTNKNRRLPVDILADCEINIVLFRYLTRYFHN